MSDIINNIFDYIASKNFEKERGLGKFKGFIPHKYVDLSTKSKEIDKVPPSELFIKVRDFAGNHIQQKINSLEECNWIKAEMTRPFFDHFNFRYKNKVFSVLIDIRDKDNNSFIPPEFIKRQLGESEKNNLVPCIFPVSVENFDASSVKTISSGWNLVHTINHKEIVPENIATDEKVEMSPWEFHNFAIMQMRYMFKMQGIKVISFQDIIGVDPQIWFFDENGKQCWAIIRYGLKPDKEVPKPYDLTEITRRCFKFNGFFASFVFYTENDKVYRGDKIKINFSGFEQIHTFM